MKALTVFIILLLTAPMLFYSTQADYTPTFNGENAYDHLVAQCEIGPRPPGSDNLTECRAYIANQLEILGWTVTLQNFTYMDTSCSNIIAKWSPQDSSYFVVGAHYDTRPQADRETDAVNKTLPVLGANDGASGVGVLLELARVLPESSRTGVEFVFFDAEDSGYINGWDWIVGSTYYVDQLSESKKMNITGMILLDMIGDTNLRIPKESSSTDSLQDEIWAIANTLGHDDVFVDSPGSSVLDDHRPFLEAGIPAVDLIHTPFPWTWHTLQDTPENCDSESLQIVGEVMETFLVTSSGTYTIEPPFDIIIAIVLIGTVAVGITYLFYRRK